MARPLVLVYQEFASLSFTPANADLNTCVAAVARHIRDYSNLADRAASTYALPKDDNGNAVPVFEDGVAMVPPAIPGGVTGMIIESGAIYLTQAVLEVETGACSVDQNDATALIAFGQGVDLTQIKVGDEIQASTDNWSTTFTSRVRSVLVPQARVIVQDGGLAAGAQNVAFRITRRVNEASVQTAQEGLNYLPQQGVMGLSSQCSDHDTGLKILYAEKAVFEYVARRTDLNYVQDIASSAEVVSKLGRLDARNPLAVAAYMAVSNAGTSIKAYGVTSDSVEAFGEFETAIASRGDIYCVVPVSDVVAGPVVASLKNRFMNQANVDYALENGTPQRFRMVVAGGNRFQPSETKIVASAPYVSAGAVNSGLATLSAPNTTFVADGVRPGDIARYGTDNNSALEYEIDTVLSNQAIRIVVPQGQSIPNGGTLSVVRRMTTAEAVEDYAGVPPSYDSKRCVLVAGSSVDLEGVAGGTNQSTAYLACAVGGMIAGLPPHQGLTNLAISGVSRIYGTQDTFDDAQLSKLSDAGWCVFIQESPVAAPFCIHGVTTAQGGIVEFSEIMSVKNFDYVSESLARQLDRFIGVWNVNDETIGFIRQALESKLTDLKTRKLPKIGVPVISGSVTTASTSAISADRVEVFVDLVLPKSLNTIGLHLVSR